MLKQMLNLKIDDTDLIIKIKKKISSLETMKNGSVTLNHLQ